MNEGSGRAVGALPSHDRSASTGFDVGIEIVATDGPCHGIFGALPTPFIYSLPQQPTQCLAAEKNCVAEGHSGGRTEIPGVFA